MTAPVIAGILTTLLVALVLILSFAFRDRPTVAERIVAESVTPLVAVDDALRAAPPEAVDELLDARLVFMRRQT